MNVAIKLLDIIIENGCCESYGKLFTFEPLENGCSRLVKAPNSGWTIPVYVNIRNHDRFAKWDKQAYESNRDGDLWRDRLRLQKAWDIYNNYRKAWLQTWWD